MGELRLQVILARAGLGSRRACEKLITDGLVTVNGHAVTALGSKADPDRDHVKVRGRRVVTAEPPCHVMLNKPRGFVCTVSDPEGRPTVLELVTGVRQRLHPVGRLDLQSQGLLLLTNDGPLTAALTHPSSQVPRVYRAKVRGALDEKTRTRLAHGILLDGSRTGPLRVQPVRLVGEGSWVEVTVHEGRKHLVRDALAAVGHPVSKLRRVALGPLALGSLKEGAWRHLTERELEALRAAVKGPGAKARPRAPTGRRKSPARGPRTRRKS